MYTDYFKLNEPPFSLTPDPRYLFMSERHREGLAHLLYGVQQPGGFVQLTGDVGSGKTTLCRCLVKQLPQETEVALILNPRLTVIELLATVCDELGIAYPAETGSVKVLIDALNQRLLESHARGRRTVLIIDEAQNLQDEVLEQVRLLTNLETSREKLLQIILIGQPELLSVLKREKLRQLAQRITARYHLLALSRQETYAYIQHRLRVSGRRDPLFTSGAMRRIYRLSRGVPRIVNIICDRAMLGAYALEKQRISAGIVRQASRETRGIPPRRHGIRLALAGGLLVLMALILGTLAFLAPESISALRRKAGISTERSVRPTAGAAVKTPPSPPANASVGIASTAPPATEGKLTGTKPRLSEILNKDSLPDISHSSFVSLYSKWGIKDGLTASNIGCRYANDLGFECLSQVGNWLKLRRYDVPAILDIRLSRSAKRQVTLIGLTDETATLAIDNREYQFPLTEINKVWDGAFTILWKSPFATRHFSMGDSSKDVAWIRRALDVSEGKKSGVSVSELFNEELKQRILAFQQKQSLIQDGFVGSETLVRLSIAMSGAKAPSLSGRPR
jgi:general secretion pathway protein A